MATPRKAYFRVACSVLDEGWSDATLATMVRLSAVMVNRWARNKLDGSEACEIELTDQQLMVVTGRYRVGSASLVMRKLSECVALEFHYRDGKATVRWPKFAEFQGLTTRVSDKTDPTIARRVPESAPAPAPAPAFLNTDLVPKERGERKRERRAPKDSGARAPAISAETVSEVFAHWVEVHDKRPEAVKLTNARERLIRRAVEQHGTETVKKAIEGYKLSPFHNGDNATGRHYVDLELILRDARHVEAGCEFFDCPPRAREPTQTWAHRITEAAKEQHARLCAEVNGNGNEGVFEIRSRAVSDEFAKLPARAD